MALNFRGAKLLRLEDAEKFHEITFTISELDKTTPTNDYVQLSGKRYRSKVISNYFRGA